MNRHDHLTDVILDVVVEEIPRLQGKTALRLGARLYEVINRHLVARAAEDVPYATPAEQSAREEAVAFQHAAADAQLLATHRFNTAKFDAPKNPTTESFDAAVRDIRSEVVRKGRVDAPTHPTTDEFVDSVLGRATHLPVLQAAIAAVDGPHIKYNGLQQPKSLVQEGLFDHTANSKPTSEAEKREAREGAAPRRGRRSRGRKPVVRDSKVRLSKSLSHFDRGPDGRRVVTLNQLALLGEKIDLPLPYVLDLLTKWRRVIALPGHEFEVRETSDVITEWALELLPQGYVLDDVARLCGVSPSTVRTWSRRRDAEPDARKVVAS